MTLDQILEKFEGAKKQGNGYLTLCPAHADNDPSLSISQNANKILVKCFAGCKTKDVLTTVGLKMSDLYIESITYTKPAKNRATMQPLPQQSKNIKNNDATPSYNAGATLQALAKLKKLPAKFLAEHGLSDAKYPMGDEKIPAVRIPYFDEQGQEKAVKFRLKLSGKDKHRWRKDSKAILYGLNRIDREKPYIVLPEGESDYWTLSYHGFNALALPGAGSWNETRDAGYFEGFEKIYPIIEPDAGGEAVLKWLEKSSLKNRAYLVTLDGYKDPSELHCANPDAFRDTFFKALDDAIPFEKFQQEKASEANIEAWKVCHQLAQQDNILDLFIRQLHGAGLVGEKKAAKLVYLAMITRLFEKICSTIVEGPSSAGKSYLVKYVLKFFPKASYYDLTAMSDRALAYSEEDFQHRFIVLYEGAAMSGEVGAYLIRSLLSEGQLKYDLVDKSPTGLKARQLVKPGPTGLITTTTSVWRNPENETRLLSVAVTDTPEQTKNILFSLADEERAEIDFESWHALQVWLSTGNCEVTIPYASALAELTEAPAIRIRRDFSSILSLIKAHALLHRASRETDDKGRIIATLDDYAVVHEISAELVAEAAGAGVKKQTRETVEAVEMLLEAQQQTEGDEENSVSLSDLENCLKLGKSSVSRRVNKGIQLGYLKNLETRKGRPKRITLDEPLPADKASVLPSAERLKEFLEPVAVGAATEEPEPETEPETAPEAEGKDFSCQGCPAFNKIEDLCHGDSYFSGKASSGVPRVQVTKCSKPV
jgi:hypothetical protein